MIYSIAFAKFKKNLLHGEQNAVVFLFIFLFFYLAQLTLFVFKSLIIVIENFQKYHLIQHEKTQPVVVTRERNKLL